MSLGTRPSATSHTLASSIGLVECAAHPSLLERSCRLHRPTAGLLAARLEASYRQETDAIGAELRRLDLTGDERLVWAVLFLESSAKEVGLAVPYLLSFSGWHDDAEAAAERLLGRGSKLAKAGALRFSRADGPLLARVVALSQEARGLVALWPRSAFALTPETSLDLAGNEARPLGFVPNGSALQDRVASAGGGRR